MTADPGLVHKTRLDLGEVTFVLNISAIRDAAGEVVAFHASWQDDTAAVFSEHVTPSPKRGLPSSCAPRYSRSATSRATIPITLPARGA